MGKITLLPASLINRIAAGEVVERPASVVKELVENALDAGARRVRVEIDGAPDSITVRDDGEGMDPEDARLCFARHATSKLQGEPDLAAIRTLGFRGEALAAIAAVAEVELVTRPPGASHAFRVRVRAGRELESGPAAGAFGTTVRVTDLFHNTPARRSFLRRPPAERRACLEMAQRLALSRPDVAFEVRLDGQVRLSTPGDGQERAAAACVLGPELAAALLEGACARGPVEVRGLVGPPGEHRPTRSALWCFVNGRWVEDRTVVAAACRAYETALPAGRFPVGLLYLTVEAGWVDVNVHPAKVHVRFADERVVFAAVAEAVRGALARASPVRSGGPAPVALAAPVSRPDAPAELAPAVSTAHPAQPTAGLARAPAGAREAREPAGPYAAAAAAGGPPLGQGWLEGPRVLGQVFRTYILAEWGGRLLIVDQHVAHERFIYERLRRARLQGPAPPAQALFEPVLVHLSPAGSEALRALQPWLARLGLEAEPFGSRAWRVRSVPAAAPESLADPAGLSRMLEELAQQADLPSPDGPEGPMAPQWLLPWEDRLLKTLACRSAVKAGDALSREQMEQLVADLGGLENPYTCPHGRPVLVQVTPDELHRRFGRPPAR
ncbi:MAG TPA: DNA mismatch repair endonuclease MutL [Thermaerobacter sp.]